jgi:uncharacterized protein YaiI (UPF0178 family)
MMRVFVDADACPVTDIAVDWAGRRGFEITLICDSAHEMQRAGTRTITVHRGADSADYVIVNLLKHDDLVITQDYGLAAMCLARGARAINQDGRAYTNDNIDGLLAIRHLARAARRAGERTKGPKKRGREQDAAFLRALEGL